MTDLCCNGGVFGGKCKEGCRLTQEKLDEKGWLDQTGMFCTVCGHNYGVHPSAPQQAAPVASVASLAGGMEKLDISSSHVLKTEEHQQCSSSFPKYAPCGFGYLPSYIRFDPTYFMPSDLHSLLVPTAEEIENSSRLPLEGERDHFKAWGETEEGGITSQFNNFAHEYGLDANDQTQLSSRSRKVLHGIAKGSSYEDFSLVFHSSHWAVVENKGAEGSILYAIMEGSATATNFAMCLYEKGLPYSDVVVPVVANTGLCMVFGAVILLRPSFPTYVPISKRLDISDPAESKVASAHLTKLSVHCKALAEKMPTCKVPSPQRVMMLLDTEYYHVKRITRMVYGGGLGYFDPKKSYPNIDAGCAHMMQVLNKLYLCQATRSVPEYPLSIRTPDDFADGCYCIIYRNLFADGYRMGCPNRLQDHQLFAGYVEKLKHVVGLLYFEAGVIHGDLYASNIMWKHEDDDIDIKIVDWDGAHCVDEKDFNPEIRFRLENYFNGLKKVEFDHTHDMLYVVVFDEEVTEENRDDWVNLAGEDKAKMDEAFHSLFQHRLIREFQHKRI